MSFIWLVLIVQLLACDAAWYDSVAAHTRLPYSKSTSDCYGGLTRTHKTVITTLLHSTAFAESRLAQTLPNLLAHTAADVGFFHTGWSDDNIVDLRIKLPFVSFITCVATSDWAAPDFRPGEFVQTKYHNAGYRSMCRWYSSRVGSLVCSKCWHSGILQLCVVICGSS